jgi:hypothetical protein
MKRFCTNMALASLLALGTADMAMAQQPTTAPGMATQAAGTPSYNSNGPGVLPNGGRGIPVPFSPATPAAGSGFVPSIPGTFLTTTPVNAQFRRLYGGLNLVPPNAVALPVGAVSPATSTTPWSWASGYNRNGSGVLPNGGVANLGATQAASGTTVYNSNGPGVLPNGGVGNLAPSTLATPAGGSAFFPAGPGTAMTIAPVNPQFNRLFSGLSAGVAASSSDGPGVVPNGSTPGGSGR